jgi:triosephosphate isomerase (TIM)
MSLLYQESIDASSAIFQLKGNIPSDVELVICPSYMALPGVASIFKDTEIKIGAQDIFWEEKGAYTGEVSPVDLANLGCSYSIVGHSERRMNLGETNVMIHDKVKIALKNKIVPIVCIGENWDERQVGQRDYVLIRALNEVLGGIQIQDGDSLVIAYEPVWAISSGKGIFAEPEEVQYVSDVIRQVLIDLYDARRIETSIRLIYGGSVNKTTIRKYTELPHISGVLVGNASTKPEEFISLIKNA